MHSLAIAHVEIHKCCGICIINCQWRRKMVLSGEARQMWRTENSSWHDKHECFSLRFHSDCQCNSHALPLMFAWYGLACPFYSLITHSLHLQGMMAGNGDGSALESNELSIRTYPWQKPLKQFLTEIKRCYGKSFFCLHMKLMRHGKVVGKLLRN